MGKEGSEIKGDRTRGQLEMARLGGGRDRLPTSNVGYMLLKHFMIINELP